MSKRTDAIKLNKKLLFAIVVLSLVFSMAVVGVAFAAYTNSNSTQRVIGTYEGVGDMFSSNYLLNVNESSDNKCAVFAGETSEPVTAITVCNYMQKNPSRYFERPITYTLTATLMKQNGIAFEEAAYADVGDYTITIKLGDQSPVVLSRSNLTHEFTDRVLSGARANADSYSVTFSSAADVNVHLELVAEPDNGLPVLRGIFHAETRGKNTGWSGYFSYDNGSAPSDYYGYNYVVTGVGEGEVTVYWDSSKVDLNLVFLGTLNETQEDLADKIYDDTGETIVSEVEIEDVNINGYDKSITFYVNSNYISRYEIVFHRGADLPAAGSAGDNWATFEGSVEFLFVETESEEEEP